MKGFVHSIGNFFLTILFLVLLVYLWAFVEIKLLLHPQPSLFGYAFYQKNNADMAPELAEGDVVIVKKGADFQQGDIILYFDSKDSLYKMHYVVSTDSNETVTKCADCSTNNEPIKNENIVGKGVRKIFYMGNIISFFKNKVVLVLIGAVGVGFLVMSQYIEYKPHKDENDDSNSSIEIDSSDTQEK